MVERTALIVLMECGAHRGAETRVAIDPIDTVTDRCGDGAELAKHLTLQKRAGILDAQALERALGEVA